MEQETWASGADLSTGVLRATFAIWLELPTMQAVYLLLFVASAVASREGAPSLPSAFADKFGAKCLDGSPPSYYVSLNKTSSQWVLFLEGGGWCYGATVAAATASCASRGGAQWPPKSGDYDSSMGTEGRAPQVGGGNSADVGGIMSSNPAINPDFHTWNKVFMHYCDGSSFGGGRPDPIAVTRGGNVQRAAGDLIAMGVGSGSKGRPGPAAGTAGVPGCPPARPAEGGAADRAGREADNCSDVIFVLFYYSEVQVASPKLQNTCRGIAYKSYGIEVFAVSRNSIQKL
jgi:hypothetical protein